MAEWSPQTWISLISATVSVIGAGVTLYWTRRRMIWDAGRELGVLRSDTLALIATAKLIDHPTWSVGVAEFQSARMNWERKVQEKEPLLGSKASAVMKQLGSVFLAAEHEVFGLVRVFSDEIPHYEDQADDDLLDPKNLGFDTRDQLEIAEKKLVDPHFLLK